MPLRKALRFLPAAAVLILGILWVSGRPTTVQGLDSGELVTASWRWTVAHPPGFPLLLSLQALFLKAWPWGTVFGRASLLNALFALGAVGLLGRLAFTPSVGGVLLSTALVLALGTSEPIWRNALMPDAFALNALLATVCLVWLTGSSSSRRARWIVVLAFTIGLANHPTLLFVLPVALLAWLREPSARQRGAMLGCGILAALGFYLLIFTQNPQDPTSWGEITKLDVWLDHILRTEYGTFQHSPGTSPRVPAEQALGFARSLAANLAPLLALAGLALAAGRSQRLGSGQKAILASLVLYLGVFLIPSNLAPEGPTREMIERFHVLPLILIAGWAALRSRNLSPQLAGTLAIALLAQAGWNWKRLHAELDFSSDTTLESWSKDFLRGVRPGRPTLILASGDSRHSALRYAQQVLGFAPGARLLGMGRVLALPELEKILRVHPEFRIPREAIARGEHEISRTLIAPNLERFDFLLTDPVEPEGIRITQLPLGRRLTQGTGLVFERPYEPAPLEHARALPLDGRYRVQQATLADATVFWLSRGKSRADSGDRAGAREDFERALREFPGCWPAARNLCFLGPESEKPRCEARALALQQQTKAYF